jgi:hypothetical protein
MKRLLIPVLAAMAMSLAACGSSSSTTYEGFAQPAGTVAVNFSVDDTVNKVYLADELQWKGAMKYDAATRTITMPGNWDGPFAPLYDDGPWDQKNATTGQPGHEPKGATAGDHIWGVTVFAAPPTADTTVGYGLNDHKFGDDWVWLGNNGEFTVKPTSTGEINATGMKFAAYGTVDLKLVVDTTALAAGAAPWDTSKVEIKGSGWTWNSPIKMYDDATHGDATAGDHKYTFVLSDWVGAGKTYYHKGLLKSGDVPQFVLVFNGVEYKVSGAMSSVGVTAQYKTATGAWTTLAIGTAGADHNPSVTIP